MQVFRAFFCSHHPLLSHHWDSQLPLIIHFCPILGTTNSPTSSTFVPSLGQPSPPSSCTFVPSLGQPSSHHPLLSHLWDNQTPHHPLLSHPWDNQLPLIMHFCPILGTTKPLIIHLFPVIGQASLLYSSSLRTAIVCFRGGCLPPSLLSSLLYPVFQTVLRRVLRVAIVLLHKLQNKPRWV